MPGTVVIVHQTNSSDQENSVAVRTDSEPARETQQKQVFESIFEACLTFSINKSLN